jgi:hypothetical protein
MPTFYKIDKERKLVMMTCSGVLTMAEALGHQESAVFYAPLFICARPGMRRCDVQRRGEERFLAALGMTAEGRCAEIKGSLILGRIS